MKRILLICISIILSGVGFSQSINQVKEFALTEIRSSDELEYEQYSYNENQLLESTTHLFEDGLRIIDSLSYDEHNNIVKFDRYQLLYGEWKYVSYVDYAYDASGNRVSRSNYNSGGTSTFNLGGIYKYYYNLDNKLIHWELLMGGTDLMQVCTLTYNNSGQLIQEIGEDTFNSGSLENSFKINYVYNADGTIKSIGNWYWNSTAWGLYANDYYYYDNNKNCIKWDHHDGTNVADRREYEYDMEYTADQLALPVSPEASNNDRVAMNNMATVHHWSTQNDVGDLIYICDFIYRYDIIDYTAVPDHGFAVDHLNIFPNPASDFITITGNSTIISHIDVLDNTGRIVLKDSKPNKREVNLDVSALKSGVYYIRLATTRGIVTEKLIVQ